MYRDFGKDIKGKKFGNLEFSGFGVVHRKILSSLQKMTLKTETSTSERKKKCSLFYNKKILIKQEETEQTEGLSLSTPNACLLFPFLQHTVFLGPINLDHSLSFPSQI